MTFDFEPPMCQWQGCCQDATKLCDGGMFIGRVWACDEHSRGHGVRPVEASDEPSDGVKYFCYDGYSFEIYGTEEKAREAAESAMEDFSDDAGGGGWAEESTQVCYGIITHAVEVEEIEVTIENQHLVPRGCTGLEEHRLVCLREKKST